MSGGGGTPGGGAAGETGGAPSDAGVSPPLGGAGRGSSIRWNPGFAWSSAGVWGMLHSAPRPSTQILRSADHHLHRGSAIASAFAPAKGGRPCRDPARGPAAPAPHGYFLAGAPPPPESGGRWRGVGRSG